MGKKLTSFGELTEMLQHLLADETPGQYSISKKGKKSYELYKNSDLVCTIELPNPIAADALSSAWAKLTCAGKHNVRHLKDGSIMLE